MSTFTGGWVARNWTFGYLQLAVSPAPEAEQIQWFCARRIFASSRKHPRNTSWSMYLEGFLWITPPLVCYPLFLFWFTHPLVIKNGRVFSPPSWPDPLSGIFPGVPEVRRPRRCWRGVRRSGLEDVLGWFKIIFATFWDDFTIPIGSMYGIYANIGCILMVNVTIYSIHGSYGIGTSISTWSLPWALWPIFWALLMFAVTSNFVIFIFHIFHGIAEFAYIVSVNLPSVNGGLPKRMR